MSKTISKPDQIIDCLCLLVDKFYKKMEDITSNQDYQEDLEKYLSSVQGGISYFALTNAVLNEWLEKKLGIGRGTSYNDPNSVLMIDIREIKSTIEISIGHSYKTTADSTNNSSSLWRTVYYLFEILFVLTPNSWLHKFLMRMKRKLPKYKSINFSDLQKQKKILKNVS
jgi:hypothetical protein